MEQENLKLKFNIISYNFVENDTTTPTEMNIVITKEVDRNKNFLELVDHIARKYNFNKSKIKYYLDNIYETLWSEYFSAPFLEDFLKNINKDDYSKLNVTIDELDKQFNLHNKTINITILGEDYNKAMKFFFHIDKCKNMDIPHVHCKCFGIERRIDLNKIEFIEDTFKSRVLTLQALRIVNKYQKELIEYWNKIKDLEKEILQFDFII